MLRFLCLVIPSNKASQALSMCHTVYDSEGEHICCCLQAIQKYKPFIKMLVVVAYIFHLFPVQRRWSFVMIHGHVIGCRLCLLLLVRGTFVLLFYFLFFNRVTFQLEVDGWQFCV